jgi:type I restriction enzyme S subunit
MMMNKDAGVAEVSQVYQVEAAKRAVPVGYKQTEVGVIPEDWELLDINAISLVPMQNGIFFEPKRKGFGIPLINVGDMYKSAPIEIEGLELFSATLSEVKAFRVLSGDILFTRSSIVPSGIAHCNIFESEKKDVVFDSHLIRVRLNKVVVEPRFVYLSCMSKYARKALVAEAKTATMTTIDQAAINRCPVLLPPKEEQIAIANTLSDVDALLSELEKLVAKKQAIKTATMQQLLTGRTRLPQFALREDGSLKGYKQSESGKMPEDWELDSIGSLVKITTGNKNTQDKLNDGVYPFFVRSQTVEKINSYSFDGEGVLTAGDGVGTGKIFHYIDGKFDFHQRVYLMHNFGEKLDGYFFFIFFSNHFYERIMSMTAKSSVDSVRREMIADMKMFLPSKQEQTAIANILSDIDEEIQALEQRLSKTRQIKQGMMQELLTGRTRLLQPSAGVASHSH